MKTIIFLTILALGQSSYAQDGQLIGFKLQNGRKISLTKEIDRLQTGHEKIEQIELKNGEIFYDFEIDEAIIKIPNGPSQNINLNLLKVEGKFQRKDGGRNVLAVSGGDGSGGG